MLSRLPGLTMNKQALPCKQSLWSARLLPTKKGRVWWSVYIQAVFCHIIQCVWSNHTTVPYGGKLSREKTFTNLRFCSYLGRWHLSAVTLASNPWNFLPHKFPPIRYFATWNYVTVSVAITVLKMVTKGWDIFFHYCRSCKTLGLYFFSFRNMHTLWRVFKSGYVIQLIASQYTAEQILPPSWFFFFFFCRSGFGLQD